MKIDIPRRHRSCSKCEELFGSGQEYHSVLTEDPKEGYLRQDFCLNCFSEGNLVEGIIHWKSHVPEKNDVAKDLKDQVSRAFHYLREAIEEEKGDEAFFFAVFLARKRKLILRKEHKGTLFYEVPHTEEMIGINKIDLDNIETENIQDVFFDKLNGSYKEDAHNS